MASKTPKNAALLSSALVLSLLAGLATSDVNQDKAECTDKLVALANCLPYVSGQSKAPTVDCCSGLKEVIDKSKRCLCLLIKDRDDPSLGLKINVTLALTLPTTCHTPTNISQCVDLLHLAPNSQEAKVFEGVDKAIGNHSSAPVPSAGGAAAKETGTKDKSGAGWGGKSNYWPVSEAFCGILTFVFIFFIIV